MSFEVEFGLRAQYDFENVKYGLITIQERFYY